jgi:predicted NBD/HSP70 family sugar kinase
MVAVFLGIDIGGSHVGVGCISAEDGTVVCKASAPLYEHSTFGALVDFVCETVSDMLDHANTDNISDLIILSIGVGCPGQCKDGVLVGACIFRK